MPQVNERQIQGVEPAHVLETADAAAYAQHVSYCARRRTPIADYGRYHRGMGHRPPDGHTQINPPAGVVEHYVQDQAVRVLGGTTLGDLQRALAENGQYLPIDGADDAMLIAEIIAHNVYGPLRISQGACKDLILGMRFVEGSGQVISVGGRTVKNVAGYDVSRFMVGNLNTLGLIVEATLRTAAMPQQVTRLTLRGLDCRKLDQKMTALVTSDAAPYYIFCASDSGDSLTTHIGYAGSAHACDVHAEAAAKWLKTHGFEADYARHDTTVIADARFRTKLIQRREPFTAIVKLIVPPASTGDVLDSLRSQTNSDAAIDALPTHGVIHLCANWSADRACEVDAAIMKTIGPVGGIRAWIRRPNDTDGIEPFAPPQDEWSMLKRIKQTMDPHRIFNPGRFI